MREDEEEQWKTVIITFNESICFLVAHKSAKIPFIWLDLWEQPCEECLSVLVSPVIVKCCRDEGLNVKSQVGKGKLKQAIY